MEFDFTELKAQLTRSMFCGYFTRRPLIPLQETARHFGSNIYTTVSVNGTVPKRAWKQSHLSGSVHEPFKVDEHIVRVLNNVHEALGFISNGTKSTNPGRLC